MTWTEFFMVVGFISLGAHLYSCGRAGASIIAPLNNILERGVNMVSRREVGNGQAQPLQPNIRS